MRQEVAVLVGPKWLMRCDGLTDKIFYPDGSLTELGCGGGHPGGDGSSDQDPEFTELLKRLLGIRQ